MDTKYMKNLDDYLGRVRKEVIRSGELFPTNRHQLAAFNEEAGEVNKAFIDHSFGKGSAADLKTECVQTAAMAMRLILEGDQSFPYSFLPTPLMWARWSPGT